MGDAAPSPSSTVREQLVKYLCLICFFSFVSFGNTILSCLLQVRPNFVMSGDGKMRFDLDLQGEEWDEIFGEREVPPVQPPAWTLK